MIARSAAPRKPLAPPSDTATAATSGTAALRAHLENQLAAGKLAVPLLPQVAAEILRMAGSPDADLTRLSALIHKDPALAGRLVRVANSPAYAPRMPIVSIAQTVAWLGVVKVRELAFAASVEGGVFQVRGFEPELKILWKTALASAAFARRVAVVADLDPEAAYLCGLLHSIGAPVVLQAAVEHAPAVGLSTKALEVRLQLFRMAGEMAAAASGKVAQIWKLPAAVAAAVRWYEEPEKAEEHARDAAVVLIARRFAALALAPSDGDPIVVDTDHPAFALLGLKAADLEPLLADVPEVRTLVDALTGA